jgi:hypothetical protein
MPRIPQQQAKAYYDTITYITKGYNISNSEGRRRIAETPDEIAKYFDKDTRRLREILRSTDAHLLPPYGIDVRDYLRAIDRHIRELNTPIRL